MWQLHSVYPDRSEAVDYDRALSQLVDLIALSAASVDSAYYVLEEMHAQVRGRFTPGPLWRVNMHC